MIPPTAKTSASPIHNIPVVVFSKAPSWGAGEYNLTGAGDLMYCMPRFYTGLQSDQGRRSLHGVALLHPPGRRSDDRRSDFVGTHFWLMGRAMRILSDMKRVLFVAVLAFLSTGCAARQHVAPSLAITTEACEKLATEWESPDVADACRKGNEIAPILEILLKERAKARKAAEAK